MLKEIAIEGLFGRFNYHLSFSEEGIMIITGPNGYGKSTILRIINCFCNDSFKELLKYNFKRLSIKCLESSVSISKSEKTFSINAFEVPYLDNKDVKEISQNLRFEDLFSSILSNDSSLLLDWYKYVGRDNRSPEIESGDSYLSLLRDLIIRREKKQQKKDRLTAYEKAIRQIQAVRKEIGKVQFIQEQRLIEKREASRKNSSVNEKDRFEYITVINDNSDKLKTELAELLKKHSSLSSELDSSYVSRLFKTDTHFGGDTETVLSKLSELQIKQEKLKKYGLADIDKQIGYEKLSNEKVKRFSSELSIYLEDSNKKYSVFESVIEKLELFEKIINKKLSFKKMQLSSRKGITIIGDDGNELNLNSLSSGEQEIIVLFYKLIFESDVSLLLIDEPEISLHIAWQKEILDNLKEILQKNKTMQIIIATHSPQIISMNWNLQFDLGGQYNGKLS